MLNESDAERLTFDCSEIEPAVITHKGCDGFELAFDKGIVIAHDGDADGCDELTVVVLNFGNGDVEPALQPADYAFDDAALLFERIDTVAISGVIACGNQLLADVYLNELGVFTNANGFYNATVDSGWSGAVTPAKFGYTFDPNNRPYTSITTDQASQNYLAFPADDFNDNRRGSMWRRKKYNYVLSCYAEPIVNRNRDGYR